MERELWPSLYRTVRQAAGEFRQKYVQYQPWAVAAVLLWAALHDRPRAWAAGHFGRGYKLHAVWGCRPLPEAWEVTPLNQHEAKVAERLFGQLAGGGYVLADGNYDATDLFDTAGGRGYQLVAAQHDKNP